jgi:putative transposase
MNQLIEVYGKPEALRLDNGPELTADAFVDWATEHAVKLMFIQPGKPNQNAFVERFNRSFREEVLDAWLFNAVSEVQSAADDWLTDYNEFRPHESLGNVPPVVFKPRLSNAEVSTSELST